MRIGILASSGGSAFIEFRNILEKYFKGKYQYYVITDRKCGIEEFCEKESIVCQRIEYTSKASFSINANEYFKKIGGVDFTLLYFLRILTSDFYYNHLSLNIHPSLLPSFKGTNAVEQCLESGSKFLGGTLHLVDEGVDTGKIIAQIQTPIPFNCTKDIANKISFLQKVYLSLTGLEIIEKKYISFGSDFSTLKWNKDAPFTFFSNPSILNRNIKEGFLELQEKENTHIIN